MEMTVHTSSPYPIVIERGVLGTLGRRCAARFPAGAKAVLITDANLAPLYLERVSSSLRDAGFSVTCCAFPAGEGSKRISTVEMMYAHMAEAKLTRSDFVVALGGGVTGDMAGFAAATFLRGIRFVQVPTSLLAQVDSSVGGKTAVDLPQGKNMVGAFWQPSLVLIDPDTLRTLPPRYLADGMGEVIKYGCIRSASLFSLLEEGDVRRDIDRILSECVDIKRVIVERDERDNGERMLLNFGHTFGHALEKLYRYEKLSHGEAVGIGMVMMARLGERAGLTGPGSAARIASLLEKYGLPTADPMEMDRIVQATEADKKSAGDRIQLVLLHAIGDAFLHGVTRAELRAFAEGKADE